MAEDDNQPSLYAVDASFVLAFILPDERSDFVDGFFKLYKESKARFISTGLLPFEVLNGLKTAVIRKRLSIEQALTLAGSFLDLEIQLFEIDFGQVLQLSIKKNLTIYDASYVFLALVNGVSLLTLDNNLTTLQIFS